MKDLLITIGFVIFLACVIWYLLWKESSERYFDGKYNAKDGEPPAKGSAKVVERKHKPSDNSKAKRKD